MPLHSGAPQYPTAQLSPPRRYDSAEALSGTEMTVVGTMADVDDRFSRMTRPGADEAAHHQHFPPPMVEVE